VAKEKKEKETSAVKYNTSGHYCGRRYKYKTSQTTDRRQTDDTVYQRRDR